MTEKEFDDYRDMRNPNGHPDRIKGNMTPPSLSEPILKGELEYGSILPNGEDWRLRKFDGGMGETEYRLFKNGIFFAQFDNRKDADVVMGVMTCNPQAPCPQHKVWQYCPVAEQIRQAERDKVLDKFLKEIRVEMSPPFEYLDWDSIEAVYIKLRQQGKEE